MFINALQTILKIDGKPYQRPADTDHPNADNMLDITLGWVIVEAVLMTEQNGKLNPSQHLDRYLLAQKFIGATLPVEISNAEAETIRQQIALRWGAMIQIAGQAIQMINKSPDAKPTPGAVLAA